MAAPRVNISKIADRLDQISPWLTRQVVSNLLGVASPFNGVVGGRVVEWSTSRCTFEFKDRLHIHNHLGGVHATALATFGEVPAGFVLLRNFSFSDYRLILSSLKVDYHKQGRGTLKATARLSAPRLKRLAAQLKKGPQEVTIKTEVRDASGDLVITAQTRWQLKAWDQVKARAKH